jgi:nucleoid DNA-binding protein
MRRNIEAGIKTMSQHTLSRRAVLRRGALASTAFGLALATTTGGTAAMNKAELIEAMASAAGLSSDVVERVLDEFTLATTAALREGDSAVLVGFGSFSISKRSARTGRNPQTGRRPKGDSAVTFDACPEFAAAIDLNPGKGDEASAKCRDADVVIDAAYIASATRGDSHVGLSKADAKRAIDGFVSVAVDALKKGDRISVSASGGSDDSDDSDDSFGSFSISKRSARTGRNPQTGKEIQIAAKNVVKFKAGAELSKAVN